MPYFTHNPLFYCDGFGVGFSGFDFGGDLPWYEEMAVCSVEPRAFIHPM